MNGWLDSAAARRNASRASASYDDFAVLQARVREQLIARLDWVAFTPAVVLDLGCGTGHGALALAARWPEARVIAVDAAPGMLQQAARHDAAGGCERLCADARALPLPDAGVDLVFSNLMLQWCDDLDAVFAEVARILRPRGLFTFTTLGPDTLVELREAWRAADGQDHVIPFTDMHDIGDGLVRAGLVEPVLDVLRYTLTYPDLRALMGDLRATGAQNAIADRARGLTGRGRLRAVEAAYEQFRRDGVLPASCEVVFGQAWGAVADGRPRAGGEVSVPLARIRRR
ncbi:MAG: malonyl-ACP O-methyltransferase BioC [Steroidobacteraceae bacterium]|nr:malonyl-ACP O-methyltransferase BioC [Steroidobacteraceae bacterium]